MERAKLNVKYQSWTMQVYVSKEEVILPINTRFTPHTYIQPLLQNENTWDCDYLPRNIS